MTVIAVASAKASPGVTTAVLAMANAWPAPRLLVAECDVAGATISAGYLRGGLANSGGLQEVAIAARRSFSIEELSRRTVGLSHDGQSVRLLQGLSDVGQARLVAAAGPQLANAFVELGQLVEPVDVLVDCGRLGSVGFPVEVLQRADVIAFVVRPRQTEVLILAERIRRLRESFSGGAGIAPQLGVLLVGDGGYGRAEIEAHVGVKVWGVLAADERTAAYFSGEGEAPRKGLEKSPLSRSAAAVAVTLLSVAEQRRQLLGATVRPAETPQGPGIPTGFQGGLGHQSGVA